MSQVASPDQSSRGVQVLLLRISCTPLENTGDTHTCGSLQRGLSRRFRQSGRLLKGVQRQSQVADLLGNVAQQKVSFRSLRSEFNGCVRVLVGRIKIAQEQV